MNHLAISRWESPVMRKRWKDAPQAGGPRCQAHRHGQHVVERIPGVSSPTRSGPALASIVLDDRWAHLRDGAFVVKDEEREVKPFANDPARESRLWDATTELLKFAR